MPEKKYKILIAWGQQSADLIRKAALTGGSVDVSKINYQVYEFYTKSQADAFIKGVHETKMHSDMIIMQTYNTPESLQFLFN